MSNRHDVIIWDAELYGTPKNFDEALEMADVLSEQSANNHSMKLKQFAAKLSKFAKKAKDEDIWQGYQQLEQDVANNSYAAFVLEMPRRGSECVLSEVVKLANKLNLIVVDEEAIMAFLPNNQVLPPENLAHWQAIKESLKENAASDFPKTLKQFKKWMEPQCDAMLAKHGFVGGVIINDSVDPYSAYSTTINNIYQCVKISYRTDSFSNQFTLVISAGISHEKINEIYKLFSFFKLNYSFRIPFNLIFDAFNEVRVITDAQSAQKILDFLEINLLSILNATKDIISIDLLVNGNNSYGKYLRTGVYIPMCIITARLASNPKYNELISQFGNAQFWGANDQFRSTEWPKLLEYLQNEVKPLI